MFWLERADNSRKLAVGSDPHKDSRNSTSGLLVSLHACMRQVSRYPKSIVSYALELGRYLTPPGIPVVSLVEAISESPNNFSCLHIQSLSSSA